jgi:hypothetical protein
VRKENNTLSILIREQLVDGTFPIIPEDPGLPAAILYGPNATIKWSMVGSLGSRFEDEAKWNI